MFSVLIPTRNRLNLLSYAVDTVRRQDYHDWEIIISDNFSDEDISAYVHELNDPRVKYFRTQSFIPVTDNWNYALSKSIGDYVIMLGDDDCLMRGYFSNLCKNIIDYNQPELIYTGAFLYAYPGVMPDTPDGFLRPYKHREIYRNANQPFWLEQSAASYLVAASLDFKVKFDYNMQFSLVSRKLIDKMARHGKFYQSPYPDYYASNAMLLDATRILIIPKPMVTIGISPKSFGFYYFNNAELVGNEFLKNVADPSLATKLANIILPGVVMNTSWLFSMETLKNNFSDVNSIRVNYSRYRYLQISAVYAGVILGKEEARDSLKAIKGKLLPVELALYILPLTALRLLSVAVPKKYRVYIANLILRISASHPRGSSANIPGEFRNILDVFDKVDPMNPEV